MLPAEAGTTNFSCERNTMTHKTPRPITRREALCRIGSGFGMVAFAGMVGESLARAQAGVSVDSSKWPRGGVHHDARAKDVIILLMHVGPSQVQSIVTQQSSAE